MAKPNLTTSEIVESHKPKNYKYKYIIKDESMWTELSEQEYDINSLDTIQDDDLVRTALETEFKEYPRELVARAKEPSVMDDGVILSKKMVTKADKKLQNVGLGFFYHDNVKYVCVKLMYERFDIIEIFILI